MLALSAPAPADTRRATQSAPDSLMTDHPLRTDSGRAVPVATTQMMSDSAMPAPGAIDHQQMIDSFSADNALKSAPLMSVPLMPLMPLMHDPASTSLMYDRASSPLMTGYVPPPTTLDMTAAGSLLGLPHAQLCPTTLFTFHSMHTVNADQ